MRSTQTFGAVMPEPRVLYFGPLKESGHFFFGDETGWRLSERHDLNGVPWTTQEDHADGTLQPGMICEHGHWHATTPQVEGPAVVHHKNGWTALSFWDRTIDTRPGCSSTYLAEGTFTFEEMVAFAKTRFPERWSKMKFEVTKYEG